MRIWSIILSLLFSLSMPAQLTIYDFLRYQEGDADPLESFMYEKGVKYYWEALTIYDFVAQNFETTGLAAKLDFWMVNYDTTKWTLSVFELDNGETILEYRYLTKEASLHHLAMDSLTFNDPTSNENFTVQVARKNGVFVKKLINKQKGVTCIRVYKEGIKQAIEGNGEKETPRKRYAGNPPADESPYRVVEKSPVPPGSEMSQLYKYIGDNISYTPTARAKNIEGAVYVQFVVRPDGRIDNIKVLRGPGHGLDEAAQDIVRLMPNWVPGEQKGERVPVYYILPIKFSLN